MKKRLLVGLISLGTASMLCGFDSAETAESILNKVNEASASIEDMSMVMGMNVDATVNIGDGTNVSSINIQMSGDFDIDYIMNPLAMAMEGTMSLSTFGQAQDIAMKNYMITNENGDLEMYTYTEDSTTGEAGWVYSDAAELGLDLDMDALMEQSRAVTAEEMAAWGIVYELAPEAADVNGTECYLLTCTIDMDTINTVLEKVAALTGEDLSANEEVAQAMALMTGLQVDMDYYVDTATFNPVRLHMDMNESDLSTINELIQVMLNSNLEEGATPTTVELTLNDLSIDADVSYGGVEAITVPEEAIAAIEAGEAVSVEEVVEEAAAVVE